MVQKPKDPYPKLLKRVLKKILPENVYRKNFGRHEDYSTRVWVYLSERVDPSGVILDIGAFIGSYALAAREVNARSMIVAFEPNPISLIKLKENCQNRNVRVEPMAVSDTDSLITFTLDSAVSRINRSAEYESQSVFNVPSVKLDNYITKNCLDVELIKIDTEGAESEILQGASNCLNVSKPIILCEVLDNKAGLRVMEALPAGYFYYYIDENSGIKRETKIVRRKWRNRNWLLVPGTKNYLIDEFIQLKKSQNGK